MSTIAAIATPNASGGIGVIRISGDDSIKIADRVFKSVSGKKLSEHKGYTASFGHVYDENSVIDECVALVFRNPKSYTGEDVVELSCHGGMYVCQLVLRSVLANGAVAAEAGEFTKRAYLNGKIDLTEAESVMNIISAQGKQALSAALNTLDGALSKKINNVISVLTTAAAGMAVWTDNPDEDVPAVHGDKLCETIDNSLSCLEKLLSDFDNGKAVTEGVDTVICGHPNVGKSTLMNLLTGYDKSIVTSVAGTTRDVVEETVRIGDIVLHLADTAGIRESDDVVEAIGINRAFEKIERAELVLAVFDGSQALSEDDYDLLKRCENKRAVAIVNKTDLEQKTDINVINKYIKNVVFAAASEGTGIDGLKEILVKILGTDSIDTSAGMLSNERQRNCVSEAYKSLKEAKDAMDMGMTLDAVNVSIDYAIEKLLEMTGEKARDAVVNQVFAKFCVGK